MKTKQDTLNNLSPRTEENTKRPGELVTVEHHVVHMSILMIHRKNDVAYPLFQFSSTST